MVFFIYYREYASSVFFFVSSCFVLFILSLLLSFFLSLFCTLSLVLRVSILTGLYYIHSFDLDATVGNHIVRYVMFGLLDDCERETGLS